MLWELPAAFEAPPHLKRVIRHAQCFSEIRHGAAILYNLFLGEQEPVRKEIVDDCQSQFDDWLTLMTSRREAHRGWDLMDLWRLLDEQQSGPSFATRQFVQAWHSIVVLGDPAAARSSDAALQLISKRELDIKGSGLARFFQRRKREMWKGDAGLGRLDYRWDKAQVILRDILAGLEAADA